MDGWMYGCIIMHMEVGEEGIEWYIHGFCWRVGVYSQSADELRSGALDQKLT